MVNIENPEALERKSTETGSDPLLCNTDLPLRSVYHPLGFSLEVVTNSAKVLEAAEEAWGGFRTKAFSAPALRLRIGVLQDGSRDCPPAPVCRAQGNLLSIIADAQNFMVCDLGQGFAFGWLSEGAVEHSAYLRYHFLEAAAMCLLAALHVTPIHAACIEMAGCGVMLCGDSGGGKSTLAFACARAGWTYISDNASYLVQDCKDRLVVGNPHQMRFRPSAVDLFPELEGRCPTPRAEGKPSIEVPTSHMAEIATASTCLVDHIVFLNRQDLASPQLVSYPRYLAVQWFDQSLCLPTTAAIREIQTASIRNLLTAQVFELRYSDLDWAVERLEALVREKI